MLQDHARTLTWPHFCTALNQQYTDVSFTTLRVRSCLHSPDPAARVVTLHDFSVTLKHGISFRLLLCLYWPQDRPPYTPSFFLLPLWSVDLRFVTESYLAPITLNRSTEHSPYVFQGRSVHVNGVSQVNTSKDEKQKGVLSYFLGSVVPHTREHE